MEGERDVGSVGVAADMARSVPLMAPSRSDNADVDGGSKLQAVETRRLDSMLPLTPLLQEPVVVATDLSKSSTQLGDGLIRSSSFGSENQGITKYLLYNREHEKEQATATITHYLKHTYCIQYSSVWKFSNFNGSGNKTTKTLYIYID